MYTEDKFHIQLSYSLCVLPLLFANPVLIINLYGSSWIRSRRHMYIRKKGNYSDGRMCISDKIHCGVRTQHIGGVWGTVNTLNYILTKHYRPTVCALTFEQLSFSLMNLFSFSCKSDTDKIETSFSYVTSFHSKIILLYYVIFVILLHYMALRPDLYI